MHFKSKRRGGFLNNIPIIGPLLSSLFGKGMKGGAMPYGGMFYRRIFNKPEMSRDEEFKNHLPQLRKLGGAAYGGGPYGGKMSGGGPYGGTTTKEGRRGTGAPYGGKRKGGGWGTVASMVLGTLAPTIMGHLMEGKGRMRMKKTYKKKHFMSKRLR